MVRRFNVICLLLLLAFVSCTSANELLTSSNERERGMISVHPTFMQEIQPNDMYIDFKDLLSVQNVFNYIKANKQAAILDQESIQTLTRLGIKVGPTEGTASTLTTNLALNPSTVGNQKKSSDQSSSDTSSSNTSADQLYNITKQVIQSKNTAGLSDTEINNLTNRLVSKIAGLPQSQDAGVNVSYHELLYATANSVLGGKSLQNFYDFRKIPEKYSLFVVPVVVSFNPGTVTSRNYMGKIKLIFNDPRFNEKDNFKVLTVAPAGFTRVLGETISSIRQNAVSLFVEANIKGVGLSGDFENLSEKLDQLVHMLSKPDFHVCIENNNTVTFYYLGLESFKSQNRLNNVNFNAEIFVLLKKDQSDVNEASRNVQKVEMTSAIQSNKDADEYSISATTRDFVLPASRLITVNPVKRFYLMKGGSITDRNIYNASAYSYASEWEYIPLFNLDAGQRNFYSTHPELYKISSAASGAGDAKNDNYLICNRIKEDVKLVKVDSFSLLPGNRILIKGNNFNEVDKFDYSDATVKSSVTPKTILKIRVYENSKEKKIASEPRKGKAYLMLDMIDNLSMEKKLSVELTLLNNEEIAGHLMLNLKKEEKQPETSKQEINIINSAASVYPNYVVFNIIFNSSVEKYPEFVVDGNKTEVINRHLHKEGNLFIGYAAVKLAYKGKLEKKSFTLYVNDCNGVFQKYQNINVE